MGQTSIIRSVFLIIALFWAGMAAAQSDMAEWDETAKRIEKAAGEAKASSKVLGELRNEVTTWRDQFEREKAQDQTLLNTLNAQLAALGEAPTDGTSEMAGIALRRAEIKAQIKEIKDPRLIASAAYVRATAIIESIDELKSNRYWQDLLLRTNTPLNPVLWFDTVEYISDSFKNIAAGIAFEFQYNSAANQVDAFAPFTIAFLAIFIFTALFSRRWANAIERMFVRGGGTAKRMVVRFVVSILHLVLLVLATGLAIAGLYLLDLHGSRIDVVELLIPSLILYVLVARWIAISLFGDLGQGLFDPLISAVQRKKSMRLVQVIAWSMVLHLILNSFAEFDAYPAEVRGVIDFVVSFVVGGCLIWLMQLTFFTQADDADNSGGVSITIYKIVNRLSLLVAAVTIVSSALGYNSIMWVLLYPYIDSLAFGSILWLLYNSIQNTFAWLTKDREQSGAMGLIPLLLGLALIIGALPFFSLFWGANLADLSEIWGKFVKGVNVGGMELSPSSFLLLIGVFIVGYFITQFFKHSLATSFLPKTNMDIGGQNAIAAGFGYVGILVSILVAISVAGLNLSSIALVAGALSVGIGFGLQNIVSNFVSGIILLIERPIGQGDWIEVGPNMGYVKEISVRSTRIETFDRTDVIVPNTDLVSGTVTNYTRGNTIGRLIVPVGVAYGSDTRHVEKILDEIIRGHSMVLLNPAPSIVFKGFGADSLDFEMRAILRDVNWMLSVKSELNHQISERFIAEGIEIPFAQRDIWIKNYENIKLPDNKEE